MLISVEMRNMGLQGPVSDDSRSNLPTVPNAGEGVSGWNAGARLDWPDNSTDMDSPTVTAGGPSRCSRSEEERVFHSIRNEGARYFLWRRRRIFLRRDLSLTLLIWSKRHIYSTSQVKSLVRRDPSLPMFARDDHPRRMVVLSHA